MELKKEQQKAEQARYNVPYDLPPEDAVKEITGQAICHVNGVLGLKGNLGDIFKRGDDLRRGITVNLDAAPMLVSARIIGDIEVDGKKLVREVHDAVLYALKEGAGMNDVDLDIELDDMLERDSFYEKYGAGRGCEYAIQQ